MRDNHQHRHNPILLMIQGTFPFLSYNKRYKNMIDYEARRQIARITAAKTPTRESAITRGWRGEKQEMLTNMKKTSCTPMLQQSLAC